MVDAQQVRQDLTVKGESVERIFGNYLLIRHGLLQSPDAVQLEPVEGLRHLSPSKVYE